MGSSTHLDIHCALLVLDLCWYPARSPGARGQPRTGCCHLCTYVIGPLVGFGSHDCHMTGHFQACMHASSLVVCFGSILILYLVVTHVVVELAALWVLSFTRNTSCCCARPSSVQINDANLKQMLANAPRKGNACMHLCTFKLTQACISGRRSAPQGPNSFPPLLHNSFLVTHHLPLSPPMCNFCIHMYLAAREQSAAHRLYRMGLLRGKHVCS